MINLFYGDEWRPLDYRYEITCGCICIYMCVRVFDSSLRQGIGDVGSGIGSGLKGGLGKVGSGFKAVGGQTLNTHRSLYGP